MVPDPQFELRMWDESDRDVFASLHSDPVVMADQGGPIERADIDIKFERYRNAWFDDGISRWAIHVGEEFAGYAGVIRRHELAWLIGPHCEVGWRLARKFWGRGLATFAARAALDHAWRVIPEDEVLCYTSLDNLRSQGVISRLGLTRDAARDFTITSNGKPWCGLVWRTVRPQSADRSPS